MDTTREVMAVLARRYAFGDLAALATGLPEVRLMCSFGQRLLDLDAEDFGVRERTGDPEADAHTVPRAMLSRARASRMPQTPREQPRGALESLRPAYALLLEVIGIHWWRREMPSLVADIHIASEYLALLAWEPVLGHAGDPARLADAVTGGGSQFGIPQEPGQRKCDHTRPERSAAEKALRVADQPPSAWRTYLDRMHSHVAAGFGTCAAECRTPCSVMTRLPDTVREALTERCRLAIEFADGPLVRLRHAAPVGHAFGVPSPEEVQDAWTRSRRSLARHRLGKEALSGPLSNFPLAGLPEIFSAIAGVPIEPDTLVSDVTTRIVGLLGQP